MTWDLRHGDWRDVLADVECDALITDPPYGARTHDGHDSAVARSVATLSDAPKLKHPIAFECWDGERVAAFVASWAPRVSGWFCAMTSHDLVPRWMGELEAAGRYVFAPLACVIRGMSLRLSGDGPSSWTIWLIVARPKTRRFASWGTLPGAHICGREGGESKRKIIGGKPLPLMAGIVRDYTRPGDLVCDPCAGAGTTLLAAEMLGRDSVGAEIDADTYELARKRLTGTREQLEMAW